MNWIDVNDDLPPNNVRVLVNCCLSAKGIVVISDAYFIPGKGWMTCGYDEQIYEVHHWHPLDSAPPLINEEEESIQRSLVVFRAACEKLDEYQ